ncbi:MAG: UDP-glucose 4-epimerase GalE [Candidatus Nitrotoga sp.]|nr:UDP-glucose 4-epimerase GalE [Candidatus Nitrotoga sp.]
MRVLITGGAGYIGSHTCVALLGEGYEVAILDNLSNSSMEAVERIKLITKRRLDFFNADVREQAAVELVFDKFKPDAVIHFAGLKSVGESVQDPLRYYDWNVTGSLTLFQVMARKGVKTLIFSSSASVYGDAVDVPIREIAPIAPANPYGQSKAMIERILADLVAADSEWRVARLRYFNPMGAHESGLIGEDPNGVPNNLSPYISQVAVGKLNELKIFGGDYPTPDGTGVRDYIHVMDLALGHLAALNYLAREQGLLTLNLGTGRGCSVLEMVAAFEKACGKPVPYRVVDRRPGDVAQSFADSSEAARTLGWSTRWNLDDMCRDAWRWQSMNPHGYGTKS